MFLLARSSPIAKHFSRNFSRFLRMSVSFAMRRSSSARSAMMRRISYHLQRALYRVYECWMRNAERLRTFATTLAMSRSTLARHAFWIFVARSWRK